MDETVLASRAAHLTARLRLEQVEAGDRVVAEDLLSEPHACGASVAVPLPRVLAEFDSRDKPSGEDGLDGALDEGPHRALDPGGAAEDAEANLPDRLVVADEEQGVKGRMRMDRAHDGCDELSKHRIMVRLRRPENRIQAGFVGRREAPAGRILIRSEPAGHHGECSMAHGECPLIIAASISQ